MALDNKSIFISGQVESVVFCNDDNSFSVLKVKSRQHKKEVILVGEMPPVSAGEDIEAQGVWVNNRDHGLQFRVTSIKIQPPTSLAAIEKYLGSGLIKGVGPCFAKKLVAQFGVNVLDIIESEPDRLTEVEGVGGRRKQMITEGWGKQKIIREIMIFLYSCGIGSSRAAKIYKQYGHDAIHIVSGNPYILSKDIRGIGFLSADKVALHLGFDIRSSFRIKAGIDHCLLEATAAGSCGLPRAELVHSTKKLLGLDDLAINLIDGQIEEQVAKGELVLTDFNGNSVVFLKAFDLYERQIATALLAIQRQQGPEWLKLLGNVEQLIADTERLLAINLDIMQKQAIILALTSKVLTITGGPGTGKTTILRFIITILQGVGVKVNLCAPTGKAAKRLCEATHHEAFTIHKTLGIDPKSRKFFYNESNPLPCKLLIVDEASMLDVQIANRLVKALLHNAVLILVGDVNQLPSVGPGNFLQDIINSKVMPVVSLTNIFRQQKVSQIVVNAHRINSGQLPDYSNKQGSDFYFVTLNSSDQDQQAKTIVDLAVERIPKAFGFDPKNDLCILTAMQKGSLGVRNLNSLMQARFNSLQQKSEIFSYGQKFVVGDRVMQTENNYDKEIFNGEVGTIASIDHENGFLQVDLGERMVQYEFEELDQLVLAYAITIHKSQGSEYPAVIVPVSMQHYTMLKRNLIYTAVTRGKQLVVLAGDKRALAIAVKNQDTNKRFSQLEIFLKDLALPSHKH